MLDQIFLNNIQVYAYHGIYPEEQKLGQKFLISVTVHANLSKVCITDDIQYGFCYGELTKKIVEFATQHRYKTLEGLCYGLTKFLFLCYNDIQEIEIVIKKPNAPIQATIDSVEVKLRRCRSDFVAEDLQKFIASAEYA